MRKRITMAGVLVAVCAVVASLAVGSAFGGRNAEATILIGISAAKTGGLAPYDLQSGQLFQMRIEQINKRGGVLGRQIRVQWIDTKSDKPTAATNAEELIGKGAVAIIATCDFDFSFPAINAAEGHKVPGIALCASSPKVATPAIVGPYGGSMGLGSDAEGVTMAEWAAGVEAAVEVARTSSRTRRSSTRRRRPTTSRLAGCSSAARSAARTPSSAARTSTSARRSRACAARSRAAT